MQNATVRAVERISSLGLFSLVGQPIFEKKVLRIDSWAAAMALATSSIWEDVRNEAANALSACIFSVDKKMFNTWNKVVKEVQSVIFPPLRLKLDSLGRELGFDGKLKASVEWDLTHYLVELDFANRFSVESTVVQGGFPGFYRELGAIYEIGHFPCGWQGNWPEGVPAVF